MIVGAFGLPGLELKERRFYPFYTREEN